MLQTHGYIATLLFMGRIGPHDDALFSDHNILEVVDDVRHTSFTQIHSVAQICRAQHGYCATLKGPCYKKQLLGHAEFIHLV